MSKNSSTQAKYYKNNRERLQRNLVKEQKLQYGWEQYKNLSEDEKQEFVEYRKIILQNENNHVIINIRNNFI